MFINKKQLIQKCFQKTHLSYFTIFKKFQGRLVKFEKMFKIHHENTDIKRCTSMCI